MCCGTDTARLQIGSARGSARRVSQPLYFIPAHTGGAVRGLAGLVAARTSELVAVNQQPRSCRQRNKGRRFTSKQKRTPTE